MEKISLNLINDINLIFLPKKYWNADFFPEYDWYFTVNTDDEKVLFCARVQENGKAIYTPHNNRLLGEYFRNRLNVANGELVTMNDLLSYGRIDIDFYKVDEENYFMDFSVQK